MTTGRERAQDRDAVDGAGTGGGGGADGPDGAGAADGADPGGAPGGGDGADDPREHVYEWFRRGSLLLAQGSAAAAEQLLARAAAAEPGSRSIRETLARAQFDAGSYAAALENFRAVALADPSDDYAQFGWGLAAARTGDFEVSAEHLALAVAMRPTSDHYRAALRQTRATLRARAGAFGPVPPHLRGPGPQLPEPDGTRSDRQEEQE
ncbi:tetratricopeptide repeat protein [Streptomyces sp. NPDC001380]|uniref:tetratricopeptide repeat protein n=1 Tax=Streptomyces sp. NPDC001380 TaxID=3364566 RepID=UPI0036849EAF